MDLKILTLDTRHLLAGAAIVFVVVAAGAGVGRTFAQTGNSLGLRRFTTPEIGPELRVSERFRMNTGGLYAVTIRPAMVGAPAGRIRLELRSVTPHAAQVFRSAEVAAAEFARGDEYRFEFEPIPDSHQVGYQLDILSSPEAPSRGVALRATMGERLPNATLLYNDIERWADLAFETDATEGTRATVKAVTSVLVLGGAWMAFALLLREIIRLS